MVLTKPPIVEMWIEFNFEPNPSGGVQPAVLFLQEHSEQYPKLEVLREDRLEFRQVSPKQLPEVVGRKVAIMHLRAHDTEGSRWLQVTPTQLVCSFLRLGDKYPGFETLSKDAIAKLGRYVPLCTPVKLRHVAIHYVDVIDIPVPPSGEIRLQDYFSLGLDLPANPFGGQISYLVRTTLRPPDGTGLLEIQLQLDSYVQEQEIFRFRMDWHKVCPYDKEADPEAISAVLKGAHDSVMRCFRASFTNEAWQLFGPQD